MKARVLVGLTLAILTPLILTGYGRRDSTGTNTTTAATVTKLGTDPTSVVAGASFSDSIRVQVSDGSSNPKSGVSVAFAVTAGGGNVNPATVITDANGKAAAKFITGTTVGTNTATATVTGLTADRFSISRIAAQPTLVWSSVSSGKPDYLAGVWGNSVSSVWAVGDNGPIDGQGTILHYNGTSWSSVSSGTAKYLGGLWGSSSSNVWAVGNPGTTGGDGTILRYNGTNWSSVSSGTTQHLWGVWGSSASDVWAVGVSGTILHFTGMSWSSVSSGTTQSLLTVWGSSFSNVWAVGSGGTILHGSPAG